MIAPGEAEHPILQGIQDGDIWGPTDVYGVRLPLPGDSRPLVLGQVLGGMRPTDAPVDGPKNKPMLPVAWVKTYKTQTGKTARVFAPPWGPRRIFSARDSAGSWSTPSIGAWAWKTRSPRIERGFRRRLQAHAVRLQQIPKRPQAFGPRVESGVGFRQSHTDQEPLRNPMTRLRTCF